MILNIDVTGKELVVTKSPEAKRDQSGAQRTNRVTGDPLWSTQVVVTDSSGGEVINITTEGDAPDVRVGDDVEVFDLIASPWASNGRSGVSYRADSLKALDD